jgi:beta-glucosidase
MRLSFGVAGVVVVGLAVIIGAGAQKTDSANPAYLNPALPVDARVDDLVGRMTLEEKASQVVHQAKAIPRLHVDAYNWWTESLHGVAAGVATQFPEPIGLAATFDPALVHEMGAVIGTEARAKHNEDVRKELFFGVGLDFWAPNLNIFRDPRWGRGQETYGEDPYLTGRMGVAFVTGMQGDDPKYLRVIATPKHYAVHSGPEPERHRIDVKVSKHDEEDTYLPAFRAAVVDGHAGSVMCVYNSINGEPGCANQFLLGDTLRDKWRFSGYVVSDCDAVWDIERGHHFVKTREAAVAIAMKRGTDLDCNEPGDNFAPYVEAVKQGLLTEKELDVSVKRLMRARMLLGMFDPPKMVKYARTPMTENDTEAHRALALKAAQESMVLLKNDGVLPLNAGVKKVAVVGPLADQTRVLYGNYHGVASRITSVLDGIRKTMPGAQVSFSPGTDFLRQHIVPSAVLKTADGRDGLDAVYFKGGKLEGEPAVKRVDAVVDFDFVATPPSTEVGTANFSARWTGFIVPQTTGEYELGAAGDDGFRLWLNRDVVVEDWGIHGTTTKTKKMHLEAGKRYAVKLEYFQDGGGGEARLMWVPPTVTSVLDEAIAQAKAADVVVAVVGITSDLEGEEMTVTTPGFKGGDRTSLDLPQPEQELLEAMMTTGKPLVVVLMNGSALSVNWAAANANAIVDAWYSGEEGGLAVAQTLTGENNPAGRLPVTFYKGVQQLPEFTDYSMKQRTYRYFTGEPLYPFGYGLSYSTFAYSGLKLSTKRLKAGEPLTAEVHVKNTSAREGDEVVEVYLGFPKIAGVPIHALRGIERVRLKGGASEVVRVTLDARGLSSVDEQGSRRVAAGDYRLSMGGAQPGSGAVMETGFVVEGETKLPE